MYPSRANIYLLTYRQSSMNEEHEFSQTHSVYFS